MLAVNKAHVTTLLLASYVSKETLMLWEEVVRETANVLVILLNVRLLRKRRMAHLVMITRTHVLMERAQVSQDCDGPKHH